MFLLLDVPVLEGEAEEDHQQEHATAGGEEGFDGTRDSILAAARERFAAVVGGGTAGRGP